LTRVAVVREAGGFGDCLGVGAVCKQLADENDDYYIGVFCPDEFAIVYFHMGDYIDDIIPLGNINHLVKRKRVRGDGITKHFSYLKKVIDWKPDRIVDLFCPGCVYEAYEKGPLKKSRIQAFAEEAHCKSWNTAPTWNVFAYERRAAQDYLDSIGVKGGEFFSVCLRASNKLRRYPKEKVSVLLDKLIKIMPVVYHDCIFPYFDKPETGFYYPKVPIQHAVALASLSKMMVCVDTGFLHFSAALEKPCVAILGPTDRAVANTYPHVRVVEASTEECRLACNWSRLKKWNQSKPCAFCGRMNAVTPDAIVSKVKRMLSNG